MQSRDARVAGKTLAQFNLAFKEMSELEDITGKSLLRVECIIMYYSGAPLCRLVSIRVSNVATTKISY